MFITSRQRFFLQRPQSHFKEAVYEKTMQKAMKGLSGNSMQLEVLTTYLEGQLSCIDTSTGPLYQGTSPSGQKPYVTARATTRHTFKIHARPVCMGQDRQDCETASTATEQSLTQRKTPLTHGINFHNVLYSIM